MLQYLIVATVFVESSQTVETKHFIVQARDDDEARLIGFVRLLQMGFPMEQVCTLVASVN